MAKRLTFWEDSKIDNSIATATRSAFNLLGATTEAEARGYTLTRTIIYLSCYNGTYAGISGRQVITVGLGMVERDAFNAGAFPDPEVAGDSPGRGWWYRQSRTVLSELDQPNSGWPYTVLMADIRSQRKVLYAIPTAIIKNDTFDGVSFSVRVNGWIRCLYKLP